MMKPDHERVKSLLTDAVTMLCKNGLQYNMEMRVEGLIGITLDNSDIVLVHLNEKFNESLVSPPPPPTQRTKHSSSRKSSQPVKRVKHSEPTVDLTEEEDYISDSELPSTPLNTTDSELTNTQTPLPGADSEVTNTQTPFHRADSDLATTQTPYHQAASQVSHEEPREPPDLASSESQTSIKQEDTIEIAPVLTDPPHDAVTMGELYSNLANESAEEDPPDHKPMLVTLPGEEEKSIASSLPPLHMMPGLSWAGSSGAHSNFTNSPLEHWPTPGGGQGGSGDTPTRRRYCDYPGCYRSFVHRQSLWKHKQLNHRQPPT